MTKTALLICAIAMIVFFIVGSFLFRYADTGFGMIVMNAGLVIGLLGTLLGQKYSAQ